VRPARPRCLAVMCWSIWVATVVPPPSIGHDAFHACIRIHEPVNRPVRSRRRDALSVVASPSPNEMRPRSRPRRLVVSPAGKAHLPDCPAVSRHALVNGWGEVHDVPAALELLAQGKAVPSVREGRQLPGPLAQRACGTCLGDVVYSLE